MFVILTASYITKEYSTDNFHKNADRIYVLSSEESSLESAYRIGGHLQNRYPEIEKTCGIISAGWDIEISDKKYNAKTLAVDPTFFEMFSFEMKRGDRSKALVAKNSAVISERFANKVYGDKDPIGERFNIGELVFVVSGVVENFRNTAISYQDVIIPVENKSYLTNWDISEDMKYRSTVIFLQTAEGSDLTSKTDDILEYFKDIYGWYNGKYGELEQVSLIPIEDVYNTWKYSSVTEYADMQMVYSLFIICLIIIIFAIFNYINLTVAQTGFRAKEMAVRKLLGASKHSIFIKMIFESTLLCGAAFLLGLFFAISAEPHFNNVIESDISITDDFSLVLFLFYFAFILLLGAITGLLPAVIISRFKPIDVVKGAFTFKSKMILSKIFITIQNILTIIFIAYSITMVRQINHSIDVDLGYSTEQILSIWDGNSLDRDLLCNRLRSLPVASSIGHINMSPIGGNECSERFKIGDSEIELGFMVCDSVAANMYGFEVISDFHVAGTGVWLNEQAMKILSKNGDARSIASSRYGYNYMIKGVIKDFMYGTASLNREVPPVAIYIGSDSPKYHYFNEVLIEINGDLTSAYNEVKKVYKEVTRKEEFNGEFIDQRIEDSFKDHKKYSTIMSIFTIIAILISSLGLLAMSVYFIRQHSMEIAVRKVFGSTNSQVLKRLVWQFLRLVVVAFIIACPIIWYFLTDLLSQYAHRINLSIWIFIASGGFTLLVSFIVVYWHSSIAANENPTKSIKK